LNVKKTEYLTTDVTESSSIKVKLEFSFVFASEHHVIGIKQRPRDGLLKVSCDGIHDDNKEEWGKR
uniref:CB1 cannabinoid receptor-interacting protein 1 n=1 Tax=Heligmosomoides polygyrus TaxID=6339 RepID=A0A183F6J9_HELPZ